MKDINVIELKQKIVDKHDFLLLDVRETFEHAMYNIGGKLIPLSQLPDKIQDLEPYKNKEIIVYCRSGMRSATAKDFLLKSGFKNARNLVGGMLAWQTLDFQ